MTYTDQIIALCKRMPNATSATAAACLGISQNYANDVMRAKGVGNCGKENILSPPIDQPRSEIDNILRDVFRKHLGYCPLHDGGE